MSDVEHLLPPRLTALADDLTPELDLVGQATTARDRYRRQRRTRIAVTAVAAAVIAVSVGVPTAFSVLSAPDGGRTAEPAVPASSTPADLSADLSAQARAEAQALAQQAGAAAAAESAAAEASPGPYQQMESRIDPAARALIAAEEAKGAAELTDALIALHAPVRLGTPPAGAACPDAAAALTQGLGMHMAYEQGALTDGRDGCQWSSDGDAAMASQPEVRLTVGVGYAAEPVERVVSGEQQLLGISAPGRSLRTAVAGVDPRAVLQRFVNGEENEWTLFVPSADGTGTWRLTAVIGDDLQGPDAGPALVQVAALATQNWGG